MPNRTIAIGDIHGHSRALAKIVELISPEEDDVLVFLGDYVNRGPDSKGVLDLIIGLRGRCKVVALLGNHELMMLDAMRNEVMLGRWLHETSGGLATLRSYGTDRDLAVIPAGHRSFLEELRPYYEIDTHFFIHANYLPVWPLDRQPEEIALWTAIERDGPGRHESGKIAVVGHTVQDDRAIYLTDHLVCIDTGCGFGGCLTAFDVMSRKIWQADESGIEV